MHSLQHDLCINDVLEVGGADTPMLQSFLRLGPHKKANPFA